MASVGWRQRIVDVSIGIFSALAVSSIAVMATSWSDLRMIKEVVAENTTTQKELQKTLTDLQVQIAKITERYVTREEMNAELDKRLEKRNGS